MLEPAAATSMDSPTPATAPTRLSDRAARLVGSPVKLTLLQLLQLHGPLTTLQLAEHVPGTSRNNINSHLATLLEDGWIRVDAALERGGRRGPRERTFALTAQHDWAGLVAEINRRAKHASSAE